MTDSRKILLLNASNMEVFPVFPYAFIQIDSLARQYGISTVAVDLLGNPLTDWQDRLTSTLDTHHPAAIFITLRNTDSLNVTDYEIKQDEENPPRPYFPIQRTKQLIILLRKLTQIKIAVGGFGFSIIPEVLIDELQPDVGVFGGPDDLFKHFDAFIQGKTAEIANLVFFKNGELISNPRRFYPPLAKPEYTNELIQMMLDFYDKHPEPGLQGAPVEIMRGCPHTCVFCSEPLVKGNKVQYRDLDAVMEDISRLVEKGITKIYIISSELNPIDNHFVLTLADRIKAFNDSQPAQKKVSWFGANYLLGFSEEEYDRLYASGFTGGWFDLTGLDDDNARVMRTPYRNKTVIDHLKIHAEAKRKYQPEIKTEDGQNPPPVSWTMFIGNPATTPATIRETLRQAHRSGIPSLYTTCGLLIPIRVFDYEALDAAALEVTFSVNGELARTPYQQVWPSFAYPPTLLKDFNEQEITQFFKYLGQTFLSTAYTRNRDWRKFLSEHTSVAQLEAWFEGLSEIGDLARPTIELETLFREITHEDKTTDPIQDQSERVIEYILAVCLDKYSEFFKGLGLPESPTALAETTPYVLIQALYRRFEDEADLTALAEKLSGRYEPGWQGDVLRFCVNAILYKFNLRLDPRYKVFFVSE